MFHAGKFQELAINPNLPLIAIRTPKVGELSRKERDDIKPMFHSKVEQKYSKTSNASPINSRSCRRDREKSQHGGSDLIVLVAGSAQAGPQTALAATVKSSPGAGNLRLRRPVAPALARSMQTVTHLQENRRSRQRFPLIWVTNFPMFEWDEARRYGTPRTIPSPRRMKKT